MKIGIDLDGVIFDSEKLYRVYTELYDYCELHRNSIIDNRLVELQDRYNWTQEEVEDFFKKYEKQVLKEANIMPGAKEVLKMLKQDGHELIVITARGGMFKESVDTAKELLKREGLDIFDNYFWATKKKEEVCKNEKVDIMIDDSDKKCKAISEAGIKTIYFKDSPCFEMQENENLKTLYNWGEVYRYIKEMQSNDGNN